MQFIPCCFSEEGGESKFRRNCLVTNQYFILFFFVRGGPLPREFSPFSACASASVPLCVSGECFAENKEVRSKGGRRGSKSPAIKSEWKGEKGHKSPLSLPPVAVYAIPPFFVPFSGGARRTLKYRSHQLQLFFFGGG